MVGGSVRNGRTSSHSWMGFPPAPGGDRVVIEICTQGHDFARTRGDVRDLAPRAVAELTELADLRVPSWRRRRCRRLGCGGALAVGAVGFVGVGHGDVAGNECGEEPRVDAGVGQGEVQ